MKKIAVKLLSLGVAGSVAWATSARADVGFSAGVQVNAGVQINAAADFDAPLAAEGTWVTLASYGHCWHPRGVALTWRPYCEGQWAWTDNGWYWQSDDPWAWACYHYGTWTYDAGYGWCWLPGTEWAPAWVTWRSGGGYVGWAPCGPVGVAVNVGWFAFVPTAHFGDAISPRGMVFNNRDVFQRTAALNATARETVNFGGTSRNVVINRGPAVADIQKASGREFRAVPLQQAESRTRVPAEMMHRNEATPAQRQTSPLNETPRNQVAPTRGVNPAPPEVTPDNRTAPGREVPGRETAPREVPTPQTPNREVPNRETAPREVPQAPNRETPQKEQIVPRTSAPPANEKTPRTEGVAPSHQTPPATEKTPGKVESAPQQQHPAEQPRPAEEPKKEEKP